ncbi:Oxoglutarate/iron-dependent dioxygenase [Artemisia annua]|uniref:Oxoglutarate/iron-dependent dioxygenase n=1 Tax=Artemisia annua TaxID=35608 RepID=A0A2U1LU01_ARTAN|nr:Oxoglutarate/iron-dependent dioxygenase [Artemisia annua]
MERQLIKDSRGKCGAYLSLHRDNKDKTSSRSLESGVVLLKNYVSLSDQVEIVNICQELCLGRRGFYEPTHSHGGKLQLHMMCFGRSWDPKTKYGKQYRSDGSEAPPIPEKLVSLVEFSLQNSQAYVDPGDEIGSMHPDICIANFCTTTGPLGIYMAITTSIGLEPIEQVGPVPNY